MIKKIYEDGNLFVIEKPAGLAVHPGAGKAQLTVVDWFFKNYPEAKKFVWPEPERAGIVHRLDKDTSGLIILAKNPQILADLQKLFQAHRIQKTYQALVYGKLDKPSGEITSFVGRDPHARRQQVSRSIFFDFEPGKKRGAKSRYKVLKEYRYKDRILSFIEVKLDTGRTHQIRVQFKSIGHPLIGDETYNIKPSRKISQDLGLNRQFLHAAKLEFEGHHFESKLPNDLQSVLNKLTVVS
jgi:23S rRNA pseudouridine1911/1915/1917 synthase